MLTIVLYVLLYRSRANNAMTTLTAKVLDIIQEELFPSMYGNSMPLPAVQASLEMAMYLGFDVSKNVERVNKKTGHQIALLDLDHHKEILALLDKLTAGRSTARFDAQMDAIKNKLT